MSEDIDTEFNRIVAERDAAEFEIRHLQRGWDAAQTALGLASEEVRELRAEVARLTEALRLADDFFDPLTHGVLSPASTADDDA